MNYKVYYAKKNGDYILIPWRNGEPVDDISFVIVTKEMLDAINNSTPFNIKRQPKIIQIVVTENNSVWQGIILGLGDDGIVYTLNHKNEWIEKIYKFVDKEKS